MDAPVKNRYVLVFMPETESSWIVNWPRIGTPLGGLVDAGLLVDSKGTGLKAFRFHPSYAIVLLLDGQGCYRDTSGREEALQAGDCIWVIPGKGHQYGPRAKELWTEIYLNFDGPAFEAWRKPEFLGERPIRRLRDVAAWSPRWKAIASLRPRNFRQSLSALAQIHLLLNDLAEIDSKPLSFEDRLEVSKLHLEAWPPGEIPDWRQLAAECGCGYEKWRKAFRERFQVAPAKFRRQALMGRAARLMAQNLLSNAELAEQFGCTDESHFSRLFKRCHGVSPLAYRRSLARAPSRGRHG